MLIKISYFICFTDWLYRGNNCDIGKICMAIWRFYLNFLYRNFKIKNNEQKFSLFGYLKHVYDTLICIYLHAVILIFCDWKFTELLQKTYSIT
jgi:hypothetical protein